MLYELYGKNGDSVAEKTVINEDGDYIGIITGNVYKNELYDPVKYRRAKVIDVEPSNEFYTYKNIPKTSMLATQLSKRKLIGCILDVVYAFDSREHKVYKCDDLNAYFYDTEIEFID